MLIVKVGLTVFAEACCCEWVATLARLADFGEFCGKREKNIFFKILFEIYSFVPVKNGYYITLHCTFFSGGLL